MRHIFVNAFGVVAAMAMTFSTSLQAHEADPPGFLTFSASRTLLRNSHSVTVNVGFRQLRDGQGNWRPATEADVWFQMTIDDSELGEPGRRRWTDGRSCPAAIAVLHRVRSLDLPRPVLPIPDPSGEMDNEGSLFVDGRVYRLNIRSANFNGQVVGSVSMSSNIDTDLADWVEKMLAALEPCWSRQMPADMDAERGTAWDAQANGPLQPRN